MLRDLSQINCQLIIDLKYKIWTILKYIRIFKLIFKYKLNP